jgi:hypothetical protein
MTHPRHAAPVVPLVDRFLASVRRRPAKHTIDGAEYLEMLWRMIRALEARAIDDPELLPQVVALAQRLDEVCNVAFAANAARYAVDPRSGASAAECGRILGVSKQAASKRVERGRTIMLARTAAAGAIPFAERRREVEAIAAAAELAVVSMADYRARRAS